MINHDDPKIENYSLTTSEEEMISSTINMPEYHADIAVGFLDASISRLI